MITASCVVFCQRGVAGRKNDVSRAVVCPGGTYRCTRVPPSALDLAWLAILRVVFCRVAPAVCYGLGELRRGTGPLENATGAHICVRVSSSIDRLVSKVALSLCVHSPSDQLQRNCASTPSEQRVQEFASAVSRAHRRTKVVAAQRHQGDHHAAAREAYGPRPVLRHDRGRVEAIPKNEATHSFTSRRLQRRRAPTVV